jgi:CHAD domain-containing protein
VPARPAGERRLTLQLAPGSGLTRCPRHPLLDALPRWQRETLTWFRDGDALLERRRGAFHRVQPMPGAEPPGRWPAPEPAAPPPAGILPLAQFTGRRATLGPGLAWIEGRLRAGGRELRLRRLLLDAPDAETLAGTLAADLPLLPAATSLAEHALALVEGRAPRPRRSGPPALPHAASAETALPAAAAHLLDVLLAELPGCTLSAGPRGVHQARVALRRLRSLIKLFRPEDPAWAAWNAQLGELARTLGAARDWDVFLPGIAAGTLEALEGDARLRRLIQAAEAERAAAYAEVSRSFESSGFRHVVFEGLRLAALPRAGETPLPPFAARLLRKRWKRLQRAGRDIEALDAPALHEMRLDAKRLRYAAEPFATLWPGRRARRFNRRLAALQEALGLANDAAVARGLAARLAGRGAGPFSIGTVTGFAAGRAEGGRLAAIGAWKRLRNTPCFWPKSKKIHSSEE